MWIVYQADCRPRPESVSVVLSVLWNRPSRTLSFKDLIKGWHWMSKKHLSAPMGQTGFFWKMFEYVLLPEFVFVQLVQSLYCNQWNFLQHIISLKKGLCGSFDFVGKDDDDRGHDQALPYTTWGTTYQHHGGATTTAACFKKAKKKYLKEWSCYHQSET